MYVFGIDFPIMEILFVFAVLFSVALVIIWLEIRKLVSLLSKEEIDIERFESGLLKLEGKTPKEENIEERFEELINEAEKHIVSNNKDAAVKSYRKLYEHFKKILASSLHQDRKKYHYDRALTLHGRIEGMK